MPSFKKKKLRCVKRIAENDIIITNESISYVTLSFPYPP